MDVEIPRRIYNVFLLFLVVDVCKGLGSRGVGLMPRLAKFKFFSSL